MAERMIDRYEVVVVDGG
jgi:putative flavoprotein involved in K+ transport